jgi:hypothetical protein
MGDGWIPIMGSTPNDIAAGLRVLETHLSRSGQGGRSLRVRVRLPVVYGASGPDLEATLSGAEQLETAGVTDVVIPIAPFARSLAEAEDWLTVLATRWSSL